MLGRLDDQAGRNVQIPLGAATTLDFCFTRANFGPDAELSVSYGLRELPCHRVALYL